MIRAWLANKQMATRHHILAYYNTVRIEGDRKPWAGGTGPWWRRLRQSYYRHMGTQLLEFSSRRLEASYRGTL